MSSELSCQELIGFLGDYLSGEQPVDVRQEFDRHLAVCPTCVSYLHSYEATIRVCRESCAEFELPPPPEELIRAILTSLGSNSPKPPEQ